VLAITPADCQKSSASSLKGAREALKVISPAVILLYLRLQDGDGIEFLREFKKFTKLPVVIIMTAYSTMESFVNAVNEGAVDYLVKPFDIEKLKINLRKYLLRA
jgi:DNA-binding NtrC family response regulator